MKKLSIKKLLVVAFLVRLFLAPWVYHSDVNNHVVWGIYANEFGLEGFYDWLNFGNYARPDYPPLAVIIFLVMRWFWLLIYSILWKINVAVPLFPSGIMSWFDSNGYQLLLKLPAMVADLGIGLIIYSWLRERVGSEKAKMGANLYLFNPAVIYISAVWGQIDSVVGLLGLMAVLLVLGKKYTLGILTFVTSILVKQTLIPIFLIVGVLFIKKKVKLKIVLIGTGLAVLYVSLVSSLFINSNSLRWFVMAYINKFISGPVTLHYINLNAFNAWGLLLGLGRVADNVAYLGLELKMWGYLVGAIFTANILYKFWRGKDVFFSSVMLYYAIFMMFPRIHERYMYPMFLFLPLIIVKRPELKKYYYFITVLFLVNLYHWWWIPKIGILVRILEKGIVERLLCLANVVLFGLLLREYYRVKGRWKYQS